MECPTCKNHLEKYMRDIAFLFPDGTEKTFFALTSGYCDNCDTLYLDHDIIALYGLQEGRLIGAIENDAAYLERINKAK